MKIGSNDHILLVEVIDDSVANSLYLSIQCHCIKVQSQKYNTVSSTSHLSSLGFLKIKLKI